METEKKNFKIAMHHWMRGDLEKFLPESGNNRLLLSFGCGTGEDKDFLNSRGFHVIGFDLLPSCGTDFLGDGHNLPVINSSFDVVVIFRPIMCQ